MTQSFDEVIERFGSASAFIYFHDFRALLSCGHCWFAGSSCAMSRGRLWCKSVKESAPLTFCKCTGSLVGILSACLSPIDRINRKLARTCSFFNLPFVRPKVPDMRRDCYVKPMLIVHMTAAGASCP